MASATRAPPSQLRPDYTPPSPPACLMFVAAVIVGTVVGFVEPRASASGGVGGGGEPVAVSSAAMADAGSRQQGGAGQQGSLGSAALRPAHASGGLEGPPASQAAAPAAATTAAPTAPRRCKRLVSHRGRDGIGHQLLGAFSCVVLDRLDPDTCYVYVRRRGHHFDHGCKHCSGLYDSLVPALGVRTSTDERGVDFVDNCFDELIALCGEGKESTHVNATCNAARASLAHVWSSHVANVLWLKRQGATHERPLPEIGVAVHVRKGDLPRDVASTYGAVIDKHFPGEVVHVFTENSGEGNEVVRQIKGSHEVVEHGKEVGTVDAWLMMAKARALFVHESSFSITASIASKGVVFANRPKPLQGRYDCQSFTCEAGSGWWWSAGHGVAECPAGRLASSRSPPA